MGEKEEDGLRRVEIRIVGTCVEGDSGVSGSRE